MKQNSSNPINAGFEGNDQNSTQNLKPILKSTSKLTTKNTSSNITDEKRNNLKEYLNEYNYEFIRNSFKTDDLMLNLRKIITDFKVFIRTSQTSLKYMAHFLFHINYKRLKGLLLRLPSWNHCKTDTKIIYSLINKFLENKEEVLENLKLYHKNSKSVTISTEPINDDENVDDENFDDDDDDDNKNMSDDNTSNHENVEPEEPTVDNNSCTSSNSIITDYINTVIANVAAFLKNNSISETLFAKEILDTDRKTLRYVLSERRNHGKYNKFVHKIEEFLNDDEMKSEMIRKNKGYKMSSENIEINQSHENVNSVEIKIENEGESGDELKVNTSEQNIKYRRSSRIKLPIQSTRTKKPNCQLYDPSEAHIEG